MDVAKARHELVEFGRRMQEARLALGTAGNLSVRVDGDAMAITPTGIPYDKLTLEDICVVRVDTGELVGSVRKPSSETSAHLALYRHRSDIQAIVHTHSLYATAFAVAGRPIEAVHYVIATMGNRIPVVPYQTYGTVELADEIVRTIRDEMGLLLANHGVMAMGSNLAQAYYHAQEIEYLAQLSWLANALGGGNVLPPDELAKVRNKFAGYGQ